MTLAQKFTKAFGGIYILVGIVGFLPFLGGTFNQDGDNLLGIFGVTLVHNLVHLAIGAAFLAASKSNANAIQASIGIGAVYLLVGVLGLFYLDWVGDLLNINGPDNFLHLFTGALALYVGMTEKKSLA